jgi:hypothetical protein
VRIFFNIATRSWPRPFVESMRATRTIPAIIKHSKIIARPLLLKRSFWSNCTLVLSILLQTTVPTLRLRDSSVGLKGPLPFIMSRKDPPWKKLARVMRKKYECSHQISYVPLALLLYQPQDDEEVYEQEHEEANFIRKKKHPRERHCQV